MLQVRNPMIKLFGKTISLSSQELSLDHHHREESCCSTSQDNKSMSGEHSKSTVEDDPINLTEEEPMEPATPSGDSETLNTASAETEALSPKVIDNDEQSDVSQRKTLKKPDKIIPCSRCKSMDTKFCYYNNYNVNQPRYFCKKCQRYWTAGGSMRNVPVGSGRRKNKNSCASNYQHVIISEADGTSFAFGSERTSIGFHGAETRIPVPYGLGTCLPSHWNYPAIPHSFNSSSFPVTFYPAPPYWGCAVPGPWNEPWLSRSPSSPEHSTLTTCDPTSPTLGKHSREEVPGKEKDDEKVLLPKTLRIDDPDKAAKSSIWLMLKNKNEKKDLISRESVFTTFQSEANGKSRVADTFIFLQANPAALSRSMNFHKNT